MAISARAPIGVPSREPLSEFFAARTQTEKNSGFKQTQNPHRDRQGLRIPMVSIQFGGSTNRPQLISMEIRIVTIENVKELCMLPNHDDYFDEAMIVPNMVSMDLNVVPNQFSMEL